MSDPRLRIALDITPLLGPPTGVHQTTIGLLGALQDRPDIDVSGYVLSFRGQIPTEGLGNLPVTSRRWPAVLAHRSWARLDFPGGRWLAGPHDVVHGTNYTVPPAETGRVVSVQDLTLITHPHWCSPAVRRMQAPLRRAVERGAHVHVTSESSAEEAIAHLGVDPRRLHVIGVAVTPVGPGDENRGRRLVGHDDYVLAVGTTEPRKNHVALVEAMARIGGSAALVVVGPKGSAEAELEAAVASSGLGSRYRRLDVVDQATKSDLLRGATVLAYPSLDEGFGLPPLEALTVGCPVVATAVGALPELIGDEVELVSPGDDAALAAALHAALADPPGVAVELADRLTSLTWEKAAAQMAVVYRQAAV